MIISIPGIVSQGGIILPPKGGALNDYSWKEISLISNAGVADEYFAVGDRKAVTLNGTVGSLSFSDETYYCYIIGINHNSAVEGDNRIHFQFGYSDLKDGTHLAFVDSGLYSGEKTSGTWFNMNNSSSNNGGWNSSRMRTVICPAFQNVMPLELGSVLKTVTKYSDNTGGGTNNAAYVTATTDTIFLLSQYEVYGSITTANRAEKNHQAQYAFYSYGNSVIKYGHSSTHPEIYWFLRSVDVSWASYFCAVSPSGRMSSSNATFSTGFAPAFCV